MKEIIEKAAVLIEALPYIQKFKGETVVVKFGGSVMDDESAVSAILKDVAFMACVGMRPVVVHGGGKAISRKMQEAGIEPHFVHGLRVTDEATIGVVEKVLNDEVNPVLVKVLEQHGCAARGLRGNDVLEVERCTARDPETGDLIDLGRVGRVKRVDTAPIEAYLQGGLTPVITPLGRDEQRLTYNVNADEAAAAIATELRARKLVFLSDVPGLLREPGKPDTLVSTLSLDEVEELVQQGVISGGMLPKVSGGVEALKAGVNKVHIIDARFPHSLLLELFTDRGVGTEIVHENRANP